MFIVSFCSYFFSLSLFLLLLILYCFLLVFFFFFSSRRRHTRCALVTGVQTCALPISMRVWRDVQCRLRIGSTLASMIVAPSAFTPSALPSPERLPSRVSLILALAPFYGCDAKQRQQCGFARFGGHLDPAPRHCIARRRDLGAEAGRRGRDSPARAAGRTGQRSKIRRGSGRDNTHRDIHPPRK